MNSFRTTPSRPGYEQPGIRSWVDPDRLLDSQQELVARIFAGSFFLEGPAGSGKTTSAVHRAFRFLQETAGRQRLLVLVPQRSLASPYLDMLERFPMLNEGRMSVLTLGGLARRASELFWPMFAKEAGFKDPDSAPTFLTLETATYVLANTIDPTLEQGAFEGLAIERNQLYRQILDNLNKAALVGFPVNEIGARLSEAWIGSADRGRIYADAQRCAHAFRDACLRLNMLDFSLQVEMLFSFILPSEAFKPYRERLAAHLIADNIEEDAPRTHDLIRSWLPDLKSALLIFDEQAGFRRFLGADPADGHELQSQCDSSTRFDLDLVPSEGIKALGYSLAAKFGMQVDVPENGPASALQIEIHRYLPESIRWIAQEIKSIVARESISPGEIAVVSPYLSDSMRFLLGRSLDEQGVEWIAYRPSRPIRQEPAARSLLTLAAVAHPDWGYHPSSEDISRMLAMCIADFDPVRADLTARILYKPRGENLWLEPFGQLRGEMQDRLTFTLGERYDNLRSWLSAYIQSPALTLDHFMRKIFGELLTQPGFGFEDDLTGASVISTLIESVHKFRVILAENLESDQLDPGLVYIQLVRAGVVSAQDLRQSVRGVEQAVSIMPAFTFLMANRPVEYQFWMDAGSQGWAERIYQPLTHPYVLNRQWERGRIWTDEHETLIRDEIAATVCLGLTRRCKKRIYAVWNEVDERGYEQRGPLLRALQTILRSKGMPDGT